MTEDATTEDVAGPVVGEETGLWLVVGGYDYGNPVSLLHLDTGEVIETDADGAPLGMIGNSVVLAGQNGSLAVVDLVAAVDPDRGVEPVRIGSSDVWVNFARIRDDTIWASFSGPEDDDLTIRGFNVRGEQTEELDVGFAAFLFGWSGDADLLFDEAGGVYERTGAGFRRVSTGHLLAAGDSLALIRECDARLNCVSRWFSRSDWEPLRYPAPDVSPQSSQSEVVADRWLVQTAWGGSVTITEIRTGKTVREMAPNFNGPFEAPSLSDDGRWLFSSAPDVPGGAGEPIVVDLDSGTEWELDLPRLHSSVAVFAELNDEVFER